MSYRKRTRWLRRLAVGLAFAAIAGPAQARPDAGGANPNGTVYVEAGGWAGMVDAKTGIPVSAGITDELNVAPTRPDDKAERFSVGSVETPAPAGPVSAAVTWNDAASLLLAAALVALVLGALAGFRRRPQLARS